ncbi:MAG TPA: hypothetical protein VKE91_09485 [Blastocatellia bacterium]|nr:hypothetical protein [Blastocatellia bacterium]
MVRIIGFKFVVAAALVLSSTTITAFHGASAAYDSHHGASAVYVSRTQTTPAGRQIQQHCQSQNGQPVAYTASSYIYNGGVLWQPPLDIECRDLFYGAGGRAGAPDTSVPFTYVRRSKSGTQKKIIVKDVHGHEWTVKFGHEARPETAATRIVWAVGYHVDQDYFVPYARIVGEKDIEACDVRFERRDDGYKETGHWSWKENPFVGTREFEGLKVVMALLKNWDLKTSNNDIVIRKKTTGPGIYYVADLGATLGLTASFWNRLPLFGNMPAMVGFSTGKAKGNPPAFADERFIKDVSGGRVYFYSQRTSVRKTLNGVSVESARWMGNWLGRLSDKQLADAFCASGFSDAETRLYVSVLRARIMELQQL